MKKIIYLFITFIVLTSLNSCAGYKPVYTTNLQFEIDDYTIKGNKKIGNQIYSKLYNLSKSSVGDNNKNTQSILIIIETNKNKSATAKDNAGKILGYKITLNSTIKINDYLTNDEILNQSFSYSSAYTVQDQYSETIKLENKNIDNLINKIYQNLLIRMSEEMTTQW